MKGGRPSEYKIIALVRSYVRLSRSDRCSFCLFVRLIFFIMMRSHLLHQIASIIIMMGIDNNWLIFRQCTFLDIPFFKWEIKWVTVDTFLFTDLKYFRLLVSAWFNKLAGNKFSRTSINKC